MKHSPQNQEPAKQLIVGAYVRFSDPDLQTDASIASQINEIRACAEENGWTFNPEFVFSDAGISGETLETRPELMSLIELVESGNAPFDGILIDDTPRLGRRVSDVTRICEIFQYHEVFLFFVNPHLDSRDPRFDRDIVDYAREDQQFLHKLRHAVRRGQKDRARNGMNPGGFRYGYRTEIVPDPTRRGTAARPAIQGLRMLIHEEEGPAVKQIFDWASKGLSFMKIAQGCIDAGYPPPARRLGGGTWTPDNICIILHNEIYRGRLIWGRTKQKKHYRSGKNIAAPVQQDEWTVVDYPDLAIVSSEQWESVQANIASRRSFGFSRLGGMAKRSGTQVPLLIGLLRCGICKQPVVSCGVNATGGRVLGCKRHKYEKGKCTNAHTIGESELEDAVIQHLLGEVMEARSIELALADFHRKVVEETERQIQEMRKRPSGGEHVQAQIKHTEAAIRHVLDSLQAYPTSKSLLAELARWEEKLDVLQSTKVIATIVPTVPSLDETRDFFLAEIRNLADVLKSNRPATRDALRRHIDVLHLTPELRNGVPVFRIKGSFQPHPTTAKVMPSERQSKTQRHYERFIIMFEFIVPARTCKKDYLAYPSCPAGQVKQLIDEGLTIREIAVRLATSTFIVQHVLRALGLRPKKIDYLNHPQCSTKAVLEGTSLGKSRRQIADDLGICGSIVQQVAKAMEASGIVLPELPSRPRPSRKVNYLAHPKCPVVVAISTRESGKSFEQIGAEMGVSSMVVRYVVRAYQISTGRQIAPVPPRQPISRAKHVDYLNHALCPAEIAVAAWQSGKSFEQIGVERGVSAAVVKKVLHAVERTTGKQLERISSRKCVDYLNHPLCSASEVVRLQGKGYRIRAISKQLRVSPNTVWHVVTAIRDPSKRYRGDPRGHYAFKRHHAE